MSMQDPIADLLTYIRNGQNIGKQFVNMFSSNIKEAIAKVLKEEGYIGNYEIVIDKSKKPILIISLKYFDKKPVISRIARVSRPGLRVYRSRDKLPKVLNGLGISIISTSKGIMCDRDARKLNFGGEVICIVE